MNITEQIGFFNLKSIMTHYESKEAMLRHPDKAKFKT